MVKIQIPTEKDKIKRQIYALKYQLSKDINEKDRKIHQQAINDLENALKKL
jgi:hypothetical protein